MKAAAKRSKRRRLAPASRPVKTALGRQAFVKKGLDHFDPHDPYYFAVSLTWPRFLLLFAATELAINTVFALLFLAQPGAIANTPWPGFSSAFFFSLETLATVGYGSMYPGTFYGHLVASCEIITGVAFTALMAGLMFARFAKPKAKILYAAKAVVATHNGKRTLMLRIGNGRSTLLQKVEIHLHLLVVTVSAEGTTQGNIVELKLLNGHVPVLAVLWTAMHVIDETSPLHGRDLEDTSQGDTRLFVTVYAQDPAMGQEVSDLHTLDGADILPGMRYVNAITRDDDPSVVVADYSLISAVEPDDFAAP